MTDWWTNALVTLLLAGSGGVAGVVGWIGVVKHNHHHDGLSVSLVEWLAVYGTGAILLLILAAIDSYWDGGYGEEKQTLTPGSKRPASWLTWFTNILEYFLVVPWTIVGQVLVLHGVGHHLPTHGQYIVAVISLSVLYIVGAIAAFARTEGAKRW